MPDTTVVHDGPGDGRRPLPSLTAPTSDPDVVSDQRLAAVEAVRVAVPGAGRP